MKKCARLCTSFILTLRDVILKRASFLELSIGFWAQPIVILDRHSKTGAQVEEKLVKRFYSIVSGGLGQPTKKKVLSI